MWGRCFSFFRPVSFVSWVYTPHAPNAAPHIPPLLPLYLVSLSSRDIGLRAKLASLEVRRYTHTLFITDITSSTLEATLQNTIGSAICTGRTFRSYENFPRMPWSDTIIGVNVWRCHFNTMKTTEWSLKCFRIGSGRTFTWTTMNLRRWRPSRRVIYPFWMNNTARLML